MKKLKTGVLILLILGSIITAAFMLVNYLKPVSAGILIETNPASTVYINGEYIGRTPLEQTRNGGEMVIKLVPETTSSPLAPYETRISLVNEVKTVVRRNFAETDEKSSGDIISFEKLGKDETSLAVISFPDAAQVYLDGKSLGFTPLKISDVTSGDHTLVVSAEGFDERSIKIKTYKGYKLTAVVSIALKDEALLSQNKDRSEENRKQEQEVEEKILVEILSTPTGFLRVRKDPSTVSDEVAQVLPAQRYTLVEEDQKSGWYKIKIDEDKEGWVSNQYAKKLQSNSVLSSTPTPTKKPTSTPIP